jgi:membrane protease YdiL (CAAX protease family)
MMSQLREFIAGPLRQLEEERRESLLGPNGWSDAWRASVAMIAAAVCLTLRYYQQGYFAQLGWLVKLNTLWPSSQVTRLLVLAAEPENAALARNIGWALWQFVAYVVGPVLLVKLVFRRPLSDYGVKLRGVLYCWPAYVAMYLLLLPAVLLVSTTPGFQHTYPFLKPGAVVMTDWQAPASESAETAGRGFSQIPPAYWPRFWIWQAFYALQFVSLEFFFRGFLLHSLRRPLGAYSILVMTIPYCMIHFGKPPAETLGAIVAGVLLGFMSLKTRSIWLGAALHIAVALTMDLAALAQWRPS